MTDWTWYFTPDWGTNGSAFQAMGSDPSKAQVRRITMVLLGPAGEMGFMRWVPINAKMCDEMGTMDLTRRTVFKASQEVCKVLDAAWKDSSIMLPNNGGSRLRLQ